MIHRDSRWWWLGILLPVIVEVLNAVDASPTDYGLSAGVMQILRLVALAVGLVSAKLATSPLRGRDDGDKVDPLPFR